MTRVLVVEDDARLSRTLEMNLRARAFDVDRVASGAGALESCADDQPDLVLLDLGLPDMDGLEVLRRIRAVSSVPVIVVSARAAESAKVDALDLGADDYVPKPFGMDELLARVRAALRRHAMPADTETVATDDFVIDFAAKRVERADGVVRLTPTEWGIVEVLVRNRDRIVRHQDLLREVWGPDYVDRVNYLRVFMTNVRAKLEPEPSRPRYFLNEPGVGWRFVGGQ